MKGASQWEMKKMMRTMEDLGEFLDDQIEEHAECFMKKPTYENLKCLRKLMETDKMVDRYLEMRQTGARSASTPSAVR